MSEAQNASRCWECHAYAPAGVCLGPHPRYSHPRATKRGMVASADGFRTGYEQAQRARQQAQWDVALSVVERPQQGAGGVERCQRCGGAVVRDRGYAWCVECSHEPRARRATA